MATSRKTLRGLLEEAVGGGGFLSLTTSGAGTSSEVVDTDLKPYGDDYFVDWWVVFPDGPAGAGSYEARSVTDFVSATGILTPTPALSAGSASGIAFELHRHDPEVMHRALNRAVRLCFPHLHQAKRDETLVVDDVLANSDFETFSGGAFTSWTAVGTPTLTQESTRVWHGKAAKVVAGGAAGQLTQAPTVNIWEITDRTVIFRAWVYATAGSTARLRLDWDGTNFENGSYHTGEDEWQLLEAKATVPSTATQVKAICEVAANGTAFFDSAHMVIAPIYRYTVPTSFLRGPFVVAVQQDLYHPEGPYRIVDYWQMELDGATRYLILTERLTPGRRLRLEGEDALSTMAADADTTEVDPPRTELLIARAAWWLMEHVASAASVQAKGGYQADAAKHKEQFGMLLTTPGMAHLRRAFPVNRRWDLEV